jgi:hypothetical protein
LQALAQMSLSCYAKWTLVRAKRTGRPHCDLLELCCWHGPVYSEEKDVATSDLRLQTICEPVLRAMRLLIGLSSGHCLPCSNEMLSTHGEKERGPFTTRVL